MSKNNIGQYSILSTAYTRDGALTHEGEALLLACLMHSKGSSEDLAKVRKIMRDPNAE